MNGIYILLYHRVNPGEKNLLNVTPERFEKHLWYIKKSGFKTIDTKDLWEIHRSGNYPQKAIMITFDDGWLDFWVYAFPLLKKFSLKAVLFVMTGFVGNGLKRKTSAEGYRVPLLTYNKSIELLKQGRHAEIMVSWEELREMEESGLVDVQSHTVRHRKFWEILEGNKKKVVMEELTESKSIIETKLGKRCNALAWPHGYYNDEFIKLAGKAGYTMLFSTEPGKNVFPLDLLRLKRLLITNSTILKLRCKLMFYSGSRFSNLCRKFKRFMDIV